MDELEILKQEAIDLFKQNKIRKNKSYDRCIENIQNDTNIIRLKRIVKFLSRRNKLNNLEKSIESTKICKDADLKYGTNLYELENKIQKALKNIGG